MALLLLTIGCESVTEGPPPPVVRQAYAPSMIPDRIVLTWSDDPATTQSVTWRTDGSGADPIAQVAIATDGPEFREQAQSFAAVTTVLATNLGTSFYHSAVMRQLSPATKYVYRVGDGTAWSEWSHFTTAASQPEPFSFVYFGDAQNDIKSHWSRVVREAFKEAPRAAFLLHAGDLVNRANNDREWGEWFYSAGWILRTMPSIATPGNHEYAGRRAGRRLSDLWRPTFEFPRNGPSELHETVYHLDYQGARLVSLDTNVDLDEQAVWFDDVMRGCSARWKIVTMHHPVYSTAKDRDNAKLRATLQPLFDRHHVDLVLQGHDHSYGRTTLMSHGDDEHAHAAERNVATGVRARGGEWGTVYVVSVSGPKMYDLGDKPFMVKSIANTQLYQVVSVDGDRLQYSAYSATGALFDRFELRKTEGAGNQLIEQSPLGNAERAAAVEPGSR